MRITIFMLFGVIFSLTALVAVPAAALTDAEAQAAFAKAAEDLQENAPVAPDLASLTAAPPGAPDKPFPLQGKEVKQMPSRFGSEGYDVKIISQEAEIFHAGAHAGANVDLSDVRLAIDLEDVSLKELVDHVIGQAEDLTGPWAVKWRLKPEHHYVVQERVNLVAEVEFGDFMNLLSERVRNMSGIELFVTVFQASRVIVITDTY